MKILHIAKKGQILNALERFEIYKLTKLGLQLNDIHTITYNPIYEVIRKAYPNT
jgi:hypothetical protein